MENTKELLQLLDTIKEKPARPLNEHILLVDGLNTLIRNFSVNLQINPTGHNVGGLVGFLKSLGSLVRTFNPTRTIIVWDGRGGSQNRKNVNPNYKAQRVHASVIHWDMYENKAEEIESLQDQADRLLDYLSCLPVSYVQIDKLEADDVIAYLAKEGSKHDRKVTIVSSDKDFLQLIDRNVQVYSPSKKVLYDYDQGFAFLQVLPENYNIVKALLGDNSDGLAGVKGVGIRGIVKEFPELQTDPGCTLDYIYQRCSEDLGKKAMCAKIINDWDRVETNYKLMNLHESVLDETEKNIIFNILKESEYNLRVGPFLQLLVEDKIDGITKDTEGWLSCFSTLVR